MVPSGHADVSAIGDLARRPCRRFIRGTRIAAAVIAACVASLAAGGSASAEPAKPASKAGPKADPKVGPKADAKSGTKADAKSGSKADPKADPKIERADRLFAEGKALLGSNLLQACGKFDESLRENPAAIGTLLNVALCDEKLGRIASAVAKFSEARDRALEQGLREHVRAAEDHIAQLAPDVPHLAITLTERIPDTMILLDDRIVALDALTNIPVDPGERMIAVSAPARLTYRATLVIARGAHQDVVIPPLASSIVVHSSQRRIGQVSTFVGGAVAGVGLAVGLYARHLYHAQFGHQQPGDGLCDDMLRCEAEGQSRVQKAHTLGNVGTAVGVAGVAIAGVGVYLWLRSPTDSSREESGSRGPGDGKLSVVPQLGANSLGFAALGRF